MKKFAFLAIAFAFFAGMSSCGGNTSRAAEDAYDEDDVEAIYEGEAFNIDDEEIVIDNPDDEEAYEMYGGKYEEEEEGDIPTGPSDVDMVNITITETAQVGMLLDQFDYDISQMRILVKDKAANVDAIEALANHIIKITEKMNEAAVAGFVTEDQLARYQRQTQEFLDVVHN